MNLLSQPSLEHIPAPPADGRLRFFEDLGAAAAVIPTDRRSNHAPSILSLGDGGLLTAWFGGSDEGNRDIDILVSRFDANTGTWSTSESVTNDEIRSDRTSSDGRLRCFADLGAAAAVIPTDRRSNHAPSILSWGDGGLLTAWFGGSDEGNRDIDILVSRFDANTGTWSTSESVTNDEIR